MAVTEEDIVVQLATDPSGFPFSTAADVVTLLTGDPAVAALVYVTATGDGTGFVSPLPLTDVPGSSPIESAALTWAMSPLGQLVLRGPLPRGIVEIDGLDAVLEPVSTTTGSLKLSNAAPFRTTDINKLLVIRGSLSGNDGTYLVSAVPVYGAGTLVLFSGAIAPEPANHTVFWELRSKTATFDQRTVTASAPSMLSVFARDFGIEVDTQESEARQRSWVQYVNEWVDRKGLARAYEILALISGFASTVAQLYNITHEVSLTLPAESVFEVTDQYGADGTLSDIFGADVTFNSPGGNFSSADVGRYVRIQEAAVGANNQLFEIIDLLAITSLRLRAVGVSPIEPILPDANNGVLRWSVVRLYTDVSPARPNFDDFMEDALEELIPGFTVDAYCWEQSILIGVGGLGGSLNVVGTALQVNSSYVFIDGDISIVVGLGLWGLTDSLDRTAYLEAVPVAVTSLVLGAVPDAEVTIFGFDPSYVPVIRVAFVDPGPSSVDTTVAVTYGATTDITITLRTNGGGAILTTAQEIVNVLSADPVTAGLVVASISPGDGTGVVSAEALAPLVANGIYRSIIGTAEPLALGPASLEYICEPQFSCDFCVSYRVLLELELDTLASDDASSFELAFDRTLRRMEAVTPAHVELIPRLVQPLEAVFSLSMTIEPVETLADLYMPFALFYDETPVDEPLYEVDSPPFFTITTP